MLPALQLSAFLLAQQKMEAIGQALFNRVWQLIVRNQNFQDYSSLFEETSYAAHTPTL